MKQWITKIPRRVWLAAGLLLVAAFWLHQHDARIRRQAKLQQVERQTAAQVSALKKQAAQDIAKANVENAEAIQKLEARRLQIEQQNRHLAAQLDALQKQEQIQVGQVATLPISEIAARVATQLGFDSEDVVPFDGTAHLANSARCAPPAQTTPHPAAGASTLSPGRGLGHVSSADIANSATSAPPTATVDNCHPEEQQATKDPGISFAATDCGASKKRTTEIPRSAQDDMRKVPTVRSAQTDQSRHAPPTNAVAMALTASGARKVETALVKLSACLAESDVQSQQVSNCQARTAADDATIQRQAGSISSLNQALQAKDRILNQQESEYKAELRAARGTFWGRAARTAKRVAIGVAVGVVIGAAAR